MVGAPVFRVLADAMLKGFVPAGDMERAYEAIKKSAMKLPHVGRSTA